MSNSTDLVGRLERERDEADRRAGSAERQLSYFVDATRKQNAWMAERKEEIGISPGMPFDDAWIKLVNERDEAIARALASESKLREIEAETREACAKIAESEFKSRPWHAVMRQAGNTIAAAIRSYASQGEKK